MSNIFVSLIYCSDIKVAALFSLHIKMCVWITLTTVILQCLDSSKARKEKKYWSFTNLKEWKRSDYNWLEIILTNEKMIIKKYFLKFRNIKIRLNTEYFFNHSVIVINIVKIYLTFSIVGKEQWCYKWT